MNNNLKIRKIIYDKMLKEYNLFIEKLRHQSPDKIIASSYEKVIKEEILSYFEPNSEYFNIREIIPVINTTSPLEKFYQDWMESNDSIHKILEYSIHSTLICFIFNSIKKRDKVDMS